MKEQEPLSLSNTQMQTRRKVIVLIRRSGARDFPEDAQWLIFTKEKRKNAMEHLIDIRKNAIGQLQEKNLY